MKCTTVIDPTKDEEVVIRLHEMRELANRIQELVQSESFDLVGYDKNGIEPLAAEEVFCFTVEEGSVVALTARGRFRIKHRLYVLEEQLGPMFVKINQSCIVNVKQIKRFDASVAGALCVTLHCGFRDYVSRRQLKTVKERMGFTL